MKFLTKILLFLVGNQWEKRALDTPVECLWCHKEFPKRELLPQKELYGNYRYCKTCYAKPELKALV